ncbi:MAG TPA: pyridoxamine 5'-phosphate oxidase family protein [Solirubrobacterales bacterium]|nr:pyridoxamine 5'-phosphate oxidase family protein [Solirubrobacterales bacterium]
MSKDELDDFLAGARTARLATTGEAGPHITPIWFVWSGGALWMSSLVRSQRWSDLLRDPRAAAVVDAGEAYGELRGVELQGSVAVVGDVPRADADVPALEPVERAYAEKYGGTEGAHDGRHAWLRLQPTKIVSWDFRKLSP